MGGEGQLGNEGEGGGEQGGRGEALLILLLLLLYCYPMIKYTPRLQMGRREGSRSVAGAPFGA